MKRLAVGLAPLSIVVDGVAYVATGWSKIYAVNAKTGEVLWKYDPKVPGQVGEHSCCGIESRGVAVYKGRVYIGTLDSRLDAEALLEKMMKDRGMPVPEPFKSSLCLAVVCSGDDR